MGLYTQSRVQFEPRDETRGDREGTVGRRRGSTGTHIGQWSIQGYGATDLTDDIEYALEHPEVRPADAGGVGTLRGLRRRYADRGVVHSRAGRHGDGTYPGRAVDADNAAGGGVMQAFTGSIHDVTKALFFKSSEDGRRPGRRSQVRALDAAEEPDRPGTRLERDEIGDTAHPSRYRPSALAARTLRSAPASRQEPSRATATNVRTETSWPRSI